MIEELYARSDYSSNPGTPAITVQSFGLSSVFPKNNPTAHSSGLSSDSAKAWATTFPASSTQAPTGRTQKVRPVNIDLDYQGIVSRYSLAFILSLVKGL